MSVKFKSPLLTIFIVVVTYSISFSQTIPDFKKPIDWKRWETENDEAKKKNFLVSLNAPGANMNDNTSWRMVDINGDSEPDLVHLEDRLEIYLVREGAMQKLFETENKIVAISRLKPWLPISFQVLDTDCCEGGLMEIINYTFTWDGGIKFSPTGTMVVHQDLEVPIENIPPFKVTVQSDGIQLKAKVGGSGADLGGFEKGSKGFAIASKKSEGITWWFVLMRESDHKLRAGWALQSNLKRSF